MQLRRLQNADVGLLALRPMQFTDSDLCSHVIVKSLACTHIEKSILKFSDLKNYSLDNIPISIMFLVRSASLDANICWEPCLQQTPAN